MDTVRRPRSDSKILNNTIRYSCYDIEEEEKSFQSRPMIIEIQFTAMAKQQKNGRFSIAINPTTKTDEINFKTSFK